MGMGSSTRLTKDDVDAIREQVPSAQYIAAGVNTREQVVASNQNWSTRIQGTDVDYPVIRFWPMKHGEFFTTTHVDSAAKVAVLGVIVSDRLYGENVDPVGESIRIRNQGFRVIGVMAPKGSGSFGEDQDDIIIAPYTTVMKKLRGRRAVSIQNITISARSADELDRTVAEISQVLRAQHKLIPGDDDDFMVRTQEDMAAMLTQVTGTMTGLLAGIAGVSLIVGGIGIMNIMLVSVTERTREIGIRMAVGAKSRDVLFQFLVEAGRAQPLRRLIGVSLGFAVSEGLTQLMALPAAIPLDAVVLAFGVAATIGIVFGVYPARKAAQLDRSTRSGSNSYESKELYETYSDVYHACGGVVRGSQRRVRLRPDADFSAPGRWTPTEVRSQRAVAGAGAVVAAGRPTLWSSPRRRQS